MLIIIYIYIHETEQSISKTTAKQTNAVQESQMCKNAHKLCTQYCAPKASTEVDTYHQTNARRHVHLHAHKLHVQSITTQTMR